MNLSLTPLSEAYNLPKLKPKTKQNMHTNPEVQKQMLTEASQVVHDTAPQGYSTHLQNKNTFDVAQSPLQQSITVQLTDPEIIEMLKIYKEDYISTFVSNLIKNKSNNAAPQVETFTEPKTTIDIQLLLLALVFLVFADIVLRLKYRR